MKIPVQFGAPIKNTYQSLLWFWSQMVNAAGVGPVLMTMESSRAVCIGRTVKKNSPFSPVILIFFCHRCWS